MPFETQNNKFLFDNVIFNVIIKYQIKSNQIRLLRIPTT